MATDGATIERGIQCPCCKTCNEWRVCDTVPSDNCVIRYRKCCECGHRLKTEERTLHEWMQMIPRAS